MLKLYFKHFYFTLFNSCLYGKTLSCVWVCVCVRDGNVGLNLVVWSFKLCPEQWVRNQCTLYHFWKAESHQASISFTLQIWNCATYSWNAAEKQSKELQIKNIQKIKLFICVTSFSQCVLYFSSSTKAGGCLNVCFYLPFFFKITHLFITTKRWHRFTAVQLL